ncbi:MAG: tetratricopeptide repeat protein [Pseudomonadota bacterium]|nr:tetratricopeptide repeat protein [Pseudomonadota bacterium]
MGQADSSTYTFRSIQEMLGLSRGVVSGLIASGFVAPGRGARNEYRFTFQDVVLLRTAVELQDARIAPRKIVAALRSLRAKLPAELPMTGLRITAVGNDVAVRDGGSQWQAESGQLVMDFELAPAKGTVAFLQRRPSRAASVVDDAVAAFSRGEALEASDRRGAEAAYRKVLAIDPDHADAYLNLGALLCEGSRCDEAVTLYDEALRRHPGEALLHFNRAIALEDQSRPGEALASYNESLRLDPDLADAHYNAARLHEQLGDAKKAVRHLSAYRRLQRPL